MDNDHVRLRPQEQRFPELEMCFLDSHRFGRCRIGDGIIIAHDAAGSGWFGRPRYTGHRRQSGGGTRRARCCGFRFPRLILFHFPVFLGSLGGFRPGLGRGIHMLIDTGYARRIGRASSLTELAKEPVVMPRARHTVKARRISFFSFSRYIHFPMLLFDFLAEPVPQGLRSRMAVGPELDVRLGPAVIVAAQGRHQTVLVGDAAVKIARPLIVVAAIRFEAVEACGNELLRQDDSVSYWLRDEPERRRRHGRG